MLPAHNGLVVLSKFLTKLNILFHKRLHYSVIGGWLQDFLPNYPDVIIALKNFKGIYVETQTMKIALNDMGFSNVWVVPNCKPLDILDVQELKCDFSEPYKLVTFSRVTPKKGIGVAADVVMALNKKYGREVYRLSIYGPVDPGDDTEWFEGEKNRYSSSIKYMGNAPFDKSVDVLSDYFALLFPTQYYTEGIPGTIIDSYAAGVPVISAKWKSFNDVVFEGVTGYGYEFNKESELLYVLDRIIADPSLIINLKRGCLSKAQLFLPKNAIAPLIKNLK